MLSAKTEVACVEGAFLWKCLGVRKNGPARGRHACFPRAPSSFSRLANFSPFSQLHHHHQVILAALRVWYFLISFRSGGVIDSNSLTYFFADSKFHIPFYKESINDYPRLLFLGLLDHSISLWSLSVLKVNEGMGGLTLVKAITECNEGHIEVTQFSWISDHDECLSSHHGCQHLCNNFHGSYSCSCYSGFSINGDNRTCSGMRSSCVC